MKTAPAASVAPAAVPTSAEATRWTIDQDHSDVGFRVRHMMVSYAKGRFTRFSGTVLFDDERPEETRIDVEIDAASIDTNQDKRDEHLRSADFFDVQQYPALTFRSGKVEKAADGKLKISGDLTIRGVTRPVVLDLSELAPAAKDPWGGTRRGASASTRISRKQFGLNWNSTLEAGGVLVGDEVEIHLDIELSQAR
jgi:polyisoprenoid-binding protein YceI